MSSSITGTSSLADMVILLNNLNAITGNLQSSFVNVNNSIAQQNLLDVQFNKNFQDNNAVDGAQTIDISTL